MNEYELIKQIPVLLEKPFLESGDRLVCFGDSLTESPTGYFPHLESALKKKGIEVINAGLGGDKTTTALTRIKTDVIDRKPTAVSIFFGTNDAVHGHGRWAHEPEVSANTLKDNLKWMVHICRLAGIRKFSINSLPGENEGAPLAEYGTRSCHIQATRHAAEEAKCLLVPLDFIFREGAKQHVAELEANGLFYTYDGLHHTAFSAELICRTMLHVWKMDE